MRGREQDGETMSVPRQLAQPGTARGNVGVLAPVNVDIETGDSLQLRSQDLEPFRRHRLLARRYLPFLKTVADFDITAEIGFHELSGTPLTVKQLLLLDVAPAVTVFRRLNRLCELGIIQRTRAPRDRRVHELRLSPAVHRLFAMYSRDDGHDA